MSQPEPHWRWLSPHALAYDGWRWHARAYCHEHGDYRDFVLARLIDINAQDADAQGCASDDLDWQTLETLCIAPNPNLTEGQQRIIELDYGMVNGSTKIVCRRSMLYYTYKRLGLSGDNKKPRPNQQLILLNTQINSKENHNE